MSATETAKKKTEKTEEFDIKEIYTPLSVAKKEIWRRWNDKELRKKVEDFLGGDVPEVLKGAPRSVTTRQLATPNKEFSIYYDMASLTGLKPLGWEFHDDIFVTTNRDKAGLGKLGFLKGFNKNFDPIICYEKLIDLTGPSEKKMFKFLKTIRGESLVEFHHDILKTMFPDVELYDASEWYKSKGENSKEYYPFLLALFICNGILFDNFNINGYEKSFSYEVVFPALKKLEKVFGVRPLIVKIVPEDDIDSITLSCYPNNLLQYLKAKK